MDGTRLDETTVNQTERLWLKYCRTMIVLISISLSALGSSRSAGGQAGKSRQERAPRRQSESLLNFDELLAGLTPVASGTGVIVFEPVATGTDESSALFGGGCSRWLQFVVGGLGDLGKTPSWVSIDQVRVERKLQDLRLHPDEAFRVASALGPTHVVTSVIRGSAGSLTLEFRVSLRGIDRPVGNLITLTGTESAIVQGLPAAASKIARSLGVAEARIPPSCTAGVDGLRTIGRTPWAPSDHDSIEDRKALELLAEREPVAAMLVLLTNGIQIRDLNSIARKCLSRYAPDNTLALHAQVTGLYGDKAALAALADRIARNYPNNYLLAASQLRLTESAGDANGAVKQARLAVQCAPASSRAWHRLGHAYSSLAQNLRRGRVIADMTQDELDSIFRVYPYWVACAKRATEIDPRLNSAWLDLSVAACFLGAEELADSSFWKVAQQDPNNPEVIWWGLEMYQPKWLDDANKLSRAVELAVQARYENPVAGIAAADHIVQLGPSFKTTAKQLIDRIESESRETLIRDANDPWAHVTLARIADRIDKPGDAFEHYFAAAKRLPDTQDVLVRLADLAPGRPQAPVVIEILKLAASRHLESKELQMAYGELLLYSARYEEAEKQFGEMAKRFPTDTKVKQRLAQAVAQQGRGAEAAKVFGEAAKSEPANSASAVARIQALRDAKLYDEAIAACRSVLKADPRNSSARWNLPEILTTKGEFEAALPEWRALLMIEETTSRKAIIQLSIAQCLKKLGRNDESMKAFAETLRLDPTGPYGKIAKTNIELSNAKQEQQANLAATSKPPLQSTPTKQPPTNSKASTQRPPTIVSKPSTPAAAASSADTLAEADSLLANGKRDEAKAAYQDALRRNPKLTKAHARLAWLLLMEKNWVESEAEVRKALAIAPDDPEANMWMASCMIFNGKKRDSLPHLRKAVAPWQQSFNAYGSLLSLLLEFGMNDEAIARGKDAVASNKNNTYFRRLLAQAYDQKGDQETALREYRTALEEDNYDVSKAITRLTVARLLWKMNRKDEARSEVQQVIDKGPAFANAEARNLLDSWK